MEPRPLLLNLLLGTADHRLSAREAVAACALFGIRENSVRVTLARLSASRMIEAVERGRYRLGPRALSLAEDVANWREIDQRTRDWSGDWICAHVGALPRSDRAATRARARALSLLGMRELDPGLFVRPDNFAAGAPTVRERLARLGLGAEAAVFIARDFDAGRSRRAAGSWDGPALDRGYHASRERLEHWLAHEQPRDLADAARQSFVLGHDAIRQLVFDPLLPAPLVDVEARRLFVESVRRFDAVGHAIWDRFLSRHRTSPSGRREHPDAVVPKHGPRTLPSILETYP